MEKKTRKRIPAKIYSQRLDGTRTRYQNEPTTDEKIIAKRKELGLNLREAQRRFSMAMGIKMIDLNLNF